MTDLSSASLMTPCAVVERPKLEANIRRLKSRFAGSGVAVRPHSKTAKCHEATMLALDLPHGRAAVSRLLEAEKFGERGIKDLVYAVGITPQKLPKVTELRRSGVDLKVVLDSLEMAEAMASHVVKTGESVPTLIEIDVDGKRAGVPAEDTTALLSIARVVHDAGSLDGVMSHSGGSYDAPHIEAIEAVARRERAIAARAGEILRRNGLPCDCVSVGSTPAAFSLSEFEGVTEMRAGVFMFFDLYQAGLDMCAVDDIALSVLATVIGHREDKGWIFVDAGWTALSADRSTSSQAVDHHYGLVCDIHGRCYEGCLCKGDEPGAWNYRLLRCVGVMFAKVVRWQPDSHIAKPCLRHRDSASTVLCGLWPAADCRRVASIQRLVSADDSRCRAY